MNTYYVAAGSERKTGRLGAHGKVLLREPERCAECNRVFLSLYPISDCSQHEGLDEV